MKSKGKKGKLVYVAVVKLATQANATYYEREGLDEIKAVIKGEENTDGQDDLKEFIGASNEE